jgi:hypothetical protein
MADADVDLVSFQVRYAEMVAQKEAARRKGGDDCVVQ